MLLNFHHHPLVRQPTLDVAADGKFDFWLPPCWLSHVLTAGNCRSLAAPRKWKHNYLFTCAGCLRASCPAGRVLADELGRQRLLPCRFVVSFSPAALADIILNTGFSMFILAHLKFLQGTAAVFLKHILFSQTVSVFPFTPSCHSLFAKMLDSAWQRTSVTRSLAASVDISVRRRII